jgi:hypothetical protein
MCFTLKVSIYALIFNIIFCASLYFYSYSIKNQQLKIISLFFLYVGVMQFWDIIFWTNKPNTKINQYSTKMAMIWNHFEPIILYLLIIFILGKTDNISHLTIIIYSILMFSYSLYNWNNVKSTGIYYRNDTKNSLFWEWNYMEGSIYFYTVFLITLLVLVFQNMTGWVKNLSLFFIIFTFFFSLYKYKIDKSVGRFWCYFASYGPLIFLIFNYMINHVSR